MESIIIVPKWLKYLRYTIVGIFLVLAVICVVFSVLAGAYMNSINAVFLVLFAFGIWQNPVLWGGISTLFIGVGVATSHFYGHLYMTRPEIGVAPAFLSEFTLHMSHLVGYLLVLGCLILYLSPWFEKPVDQEK